MRILQSSTFIFMALSLAGCGTTGTTTSTGGNPPPANKNAVGTLAPDGNPLSTATVTRTGSVGSEGLSVAVDGRTFNLPNKLRTQDYGTLSLTQTIYGNEADEQTSSQLADELSLQYASIIILTDGVAGESLETRVSNGDFVLIAHGTLETPTGNMPVQIVNYDGVYFFVPNEAAQPMNGGFTAVADFNAQGGGTVTIASGGVLNGTFAIAGNKFGGNFTASEAGRTANGTLAGGFYGPQAQEIAGVAGMTVTGGSDPDATYSGGFIGREASPPPP